MRVVTKRLCRPLYLAAAAAAAAAASSSSRRPVPISRGLTTWRRSLPLISHWDNASRGVLESPWSAAQLRGLKSRGADVRPGNVIERKGRIYQVLTAKHAMQGRGGASIQVELRDVDSGNKVNERFRTDEMIERVYVEQKSFTYLYTDDATGIVVLMDPDTYSQLEVSKDLFGESHVYLQEDMTITVELYDGRPMSASVPTKVACTVSEAQVPVKGSTATPQYKKVLLENGLTVQVPAHILAGEKILINTNDNSYISRA